MTKTPVLEVTVPSQEDIGIGLVWGAAAIARELNLKNERQAFYLLERGLIPAKLIGRQWVVSRDALRAYFADMTK